MPINQIPVCDITIKYNLVSKSSENRSAKALLVFAHGAGADMDSEFISDFTGRLNAINCDVIRFNFPYMDKRAIDGKRRPPDRMPALLTCYEKVLSNITTNLPVFLIGKSMGGRVAATLVADDINVSGVICLGYPFHPQKKPEKLRLEPLQKTTKPILIMQGERDALGSKSEIVDYDLSSLCDLVYLTDGDHNLKPRVKSGFTHQQHIESALTAISRFIDEIG